MSNTTSKYRLQAIVNNSDIPSYLLNSPFADLLQYHNLQSNFKNYDNPQLAIVMCMDNRKQLNIPNKFAYILRNF